MSAKWIRSQEWERRRLTGSLTPVRWVLHALSIVPTAVCLLVGVTLFGVLASVPVGMIAQIPTYFIYLLTYLLTLGLIWVLPVWGMWRLMSQSGVGVRFTVGVLYSIGAILVASYLWGTFAWPLMHWDERSGSGLMLFSDFVSRYKAITFRRLPGMEMTELEFYAWWPLKVLLVLFVVNMIVTTVRRIDFAFEKIGVLSVHTGIVILALGSAWYATFKKEGDMLLLAGPADLKTGQPTPGPAAVGFFDNIRTVLRVNQVRTPEEAAKLKLPENLQWDQRLLRGVPRYSDYNLSAAGGESAGTGSDEGRTLSVPIDAGVAMKGFDPLVDPDIRFRVVGYATYAEMVESWREAPPSPKGQGQGTPLRVVDLYAAEVSPDGKPVPGSQLRPMTGFRLAPGIPADRVATTLQGFVTLEYTAGLSEERWQELATPPLPDGELHGLVVEVPGPGGTTAKMYPMHAGDRWTVGEGAGGGGVWTLEVRQIAPTPPFPIITPTHKGATSSVAVVRVTGPGGKKFDRYVYSRYPELNQDLSVAPQATTGMPKRTAPDPAIKLAYIDATAVRVNLDEQPDGTVRSIVRAPKIGVKQLSGLKDGDMIPIAANVLAARLGRRQGSMEKIGVPRPVPENERERESIGTHRKAALAVEVSSAKIADWKYVVWLPFAQYNQAGDEGEVVHLPDGRAVEMAFGRLWHPLPMQVQLTDFEMYPYPHSTQPRDFRSDLLVTRVAADGSEQSERHYTSLNDPLLIASGMPLMGRFKFSQSGWDNTGWQQTKAQADAGQMPRPFARFTILGVGNDPGKPVIVAGVVLVLLGIPWAFYLKPWLVKRKSERLRAAVARGEKPVGKKAR